MFKNLKTIITELAKNAVLVAEKELGTGKGQQKKQMAIKYIIEHLPFSPLTKNIISIFLSKFIDNAIESIVSQINSMSKEKGE
jgi:hypothetical protein